MALLLKLHSYVRFGVLGMGVVALLIFVLGAATGRAAGRNVRAYGASFIGLLDLQVVLGIALVGMGDRSPALFGHILPMLIGTVWAHFALAMNRRARTPGYVLPILGVGGALVLIAFGIWAIRPTLFAGRFL